MTSLHCHNTDISLMDSHQPDFLLVVGPYNGGLLKSDRILETVLENQANVEKLLEIGFGFSLSIEIVAYRHKQLCYSANYR